MEVKKVLQKFFRGYVVLEETESVINGKIQVLEDIFGKRRLVVGGLTQSGEAVEKIWEAAIKVISNWKLVIRNCLILGLGAGNAAKVLAKGEGRRAKILGIEIDPEIIRLGKRYFGLGEAKNLRILNEDAINWLRSCSNDLYPPCGEAGHGSRRFQLILVDLYKGDQVLPETENNEFLQNIKKILVPDGIVIFNRLYYSEKKEKTDKFLEKLKKYFSKIEAKIVETNKLFLCQNIDTK
ncbi:MAG: spermidine synthase [Patescibacteria group bacterium]